MTADQAPSDNGVGADSSIEAAQAANLLWEEYKFRQAHYWSSLHRFAFAVITLWVVPYLGKDIIQRLGWGVGAFLLFVAFLLSVTTGWLLNAEYLRLRRVRESYDDLLSGFLKRTDEGERPSLREESGFGGCVDRLLNKKVFWHRIGLATSLVYFGGFSALSLVNLVVYWLWARTWG